ncbi:hypothetical protein TNCV_958701 [Trichonephila clavipes]|nr:hypothetical protein TNCV_958701 [Trichonephila clavipes]
MFGTCSDDALLRDQGHLLLSEKIALLEECNSIPQILIDNPHRIHGKQKVVSDFPGSRSSPSCLPKDVGGKKARPDTSIIIP